MNVQGSTLAGQLLSLYVAAERQKSTGLLKRAHGIMYSFKTFFITSATENVDTQIFRMI